MALPLVTSALSSPRGIATEFVSFSPDTTCSTASDVTPLLTKGRQMGRV